MQHPAAGLWPGWRYTADLGCIGPSRLGVMLTPSHWQCVLSTAVVLAWFRQAVPQECRMVWCHQVVFAW